jgi:translation initiation factor 4E
LFKKGIWPAWEDDQNKKGGKWVATFPSNRQKLEDQWLYALLACIGETFDFSEQICGCVVSLRKQDRISLWTKEATDREACMAIGQHFKQILGIVDRIEYQAHDEAIVRNSSFRNRAIHSL